MPPPDRIRLLAFREDSLAIAQGKLRAFARSVSNLDVAAENRIELLSFWVGGLQQEPPPVPVLERGKSWW